MSKQRTTSTLIDLMDANSIRGLLFLLLLVISGMIAIGVGWYVYTLQYIDYEAGTWVDTKYYMVRMPETEQVIGTVSVTKWSIHDCGLQVTHPNGDVNTYRDFNSIENQMAMSLTVTIPFNDVEFRFVGNCGIVKFTSQQTTFRLFVNDTAAEAGIFVVVVIFGFLVSLGGLGLAKWRRHSDTPAKSTLDN